MPRPPRLSEEERKIRAKASRRKWERKVGIRQGTPPTAPAAPAVNPAHRPITRSRSADVQLATQEQPPPLLEPSQSHGLPSSQPTSLQNGRGESLAPALDDDDFNALGGDIDYISNSGFVAGDQDDPPEEEEEEEEEEEQLTGLLIADRNRRLL